MNKPSASSGVSDVIPDMIRYPVINGLVPRRSLSSNLFIGDGDEAWIPAFAGMTTRGKPRGIEPIKIKGNKMFKKDIRVDAIWDDDAKVWVASSEDVTGLITEAETMEHLVDKLKILIPELLQANGQIDNGDSLDIPLHLVTRREEMIKR